MITTPAPDHEPHRSTRAGRTRRAAAGAGALALAASLTACTASADADETADGFWDTSTVHEISVEYDEADYQEMLDTFADTGEKDWIEATVTIDGEEYDDVGLRLKGNSSLRGLSGDTDTTAPAPDEGDGSVSADDPTGLPWLIRLDKYVDGQEHDGRADYVVRGNNSETSLNEAVALKVLELSDVQAEQASYARFSVNGSDEQLRLVVDLPDDDLWNEDNYPDEGITYKADSEGDWTYRGEDVADYADAFEAEYDSTGGTDDEAYEPLVAFLDFVNNSTDEEFAEQLGDYLDVDSFARYLAAQDLVANQDDIDGPGNNAYLHYDVATGLMTVVAWDQNLSYGVLGGGGGGGGGFGGGRAGGGGERPEGGPGDGTAPEGMEPPEGMELPDGAELPANLDGAAQDGGMGGGMGGRDNPLVTRFLADDDFAAAYESATDELTASVYESGDAQEYLDGLVETLTDQASDLVDADTIASEAEDLSAQLTGSADQETDSASASGSAPASE